jgi:predicted alpha/beta superfamily hydrolase
MQVHPAMNPRFIFLVLFVGLIGTAGLRAEPPAPPVTLADTEDRSITSKIVGQTYEVMVSLPEHYATSGKTYPVLYVLDGWHFPLMAFLAENSVYSGKMPPLIIVNLSHGDVNYLKLRERDFTPTKVADEVMSGGADKFLAFLEEELIPFIDHTYRTDTSDRALLGHSYGGLFAVYALLHRPALFQRVVAASPALDWDNGVLMQAAPELLKHGTFQTRVDFSYGSDEGDLSTVRPFFQALETIKPAGLDYRYTVYPGENHNSVRPFSFTSGLDWVYRDWKK